MAVRALQLAPQMMACAVCPQIGYEGAAQVFQEGSLLIVSSNQLIIATTTPTSGLVGVAAATASGVTAAAVAYYPALPGVVLEATLRDSSAGDVTLAKTHLLAAVGLTLASGKWYADPNVTSCCTIIGFRDAVGTVDARVYILLDGDVTVYAS